MAVPTPVSKIRERELARYGSNNLVFPEDIGPQGMFLMFRDYNFSSSRAAGFSRLEEKSVGDTILLPIPKSLEDRTALNIQAMQMDLGGAFMAEAASASADKTGAGIADMMNNVRTALTNQLPKGSDIADALANIFGKGPAGASENLSSQIAFLLRRSLDKGGFTRSADTGLGSTINPKSAITFDGVNLKPHSFNWEFAVRSRRESDIVRSIFQTLKRNSLPEYIGITGSADNTIASRALLKYPSMVDIFLVGLDQSYYMQFKTSMIQSVDINFSPEGNVIMEGGKPGIMQLNLQLLETDIHVSEDYGGDSSGGATGSTFSGGGGR